MERNRTACVLLAVLVAAAVAARTLPPWGDVFPGGGEVRLFGVDSLYHLRHIRYAVAHFPELQRWDHATHYPTGQRANNPGLFDLTIAAASLPWPDAVDTVAALAPVVLAVGVFTSLYALGTVLAGRAAGLLAAAILLLYPGGLLTRSLLGFTDHHVAEAMLGLLAVRGAVRSLESRRPWWRPALLHALPLAVFLFTWVGAPIYLVLIATALFLAALARLGMGADLGAIPATVARYGLGILVVVLPIAILAPGLVMDPGRFPLVIAALAALVVGAAPILAGAEVIARRSGRPRAVAAVLLAAALAITALVVRELPGALRLATDLLAAKTAAVDEHRPVTFALVAEGHGAFLYVALLAPLLALLRGRRPGACGRLVASLTGVLVIGLWILTRDYAYAAAPFVALLAALALADGWQRLAGTVPRSLAAAALAVVAVAPIAPLGWAQLPWPGREAIDRLTIVDDGWRAALHWMAASTPPPTLAVDAPAGAWAGDDFAYPPGTYGVWTAWDYGNLVPLLARRPVVASQGVTGHGTRWLLAEDELRSLRGLDAECTGSERVRYLVLDARTLGDHFLAHAGLAGRSSDEYRAPIGRILIDGQAVDLYSYGPRYERSIAARLYYQDGTGLAHYRLVFASPQQSFSSYVAELGTARNPRPTRMRRRAVALRSAGERRTYENILQQRRVVAVPGEGYIYDAIITSSVKIFERVAGVQVAGRAPAGASVEASLALRSLADGRTLEYRTRTSAGADGRYQLGLPHATGRGAPTAVEALAPYRLQAWTPGRDVVVERTVDVSEEDVQQGGTLAIDLLPGGA